uniref:Uncharacterized protein n=1 Tax=Triticum urartu TaxID=4572 RepID=A0A8R7PKL6_TRIUA
MADICSPVNRGRVARRCGQGKNCPRKAQAIKPSIRSPLQSLDLDQKIRRALSSTHGLLVL